MKRIFFLILLLASAVSSEAGVKAFLTYTTFNTPDGGAYMESYMSISGKSLRYVKQPNGKFQAELEVLYTFERNDSIKSFQKIILKSPIIDDTTSATIVDFMSAERFFVPSGTHNFVISIRDVNSNSEPVTSSELITINYPVDKVTVSGIQMISSFEKSEIKDNFNKHGYRIHPYFSDFYPDYNNQITFYYETYNTKLIDSDNQTFISKYYIENATTKKPVGGFIKQKKAKCSEVDVNFGMFNISGLPSGNYYLVVEALDTSGKLLAFNSIFFQRSNPKLQTNNSYTQVDISNTFASKITDFDTLRMYLDYLYPIMEGDYTVGLNSIMLDQKQNIDSIINSPLYKKQKTLIMQQFFYDFWASKNSITPEEEWIKYLGLVNDVNRRYKSINIKGYQSDRGRVMLQYGPPNSISTESMGAYSYPYEIWHYYLIKGQGNRKFVFYNVDRVTNSYQLLHSDVTGEFYESEWEKILNGRRQGPGSHDDKSTDPTWGGRTGDYWKNPR